MHRILIAVAALSFAGAAAAQQVPDPNADVSVAQPTYVAERGPRLTIDGGHNNFHTVDGRYAAFARLARNDGYRVDGSTAPLTAAGLAETTILVIANAASPSSGGAPFSAEEAAVLHQWVEGGGALLLIADHAPFPAAIRPLAEAFGVSWEDAYAVRPGAGGADLFRPGAGLGDHPIVSGERGGTPVTQVRTFTGSAFTPPAGATPLLTLGEGFVFIDAAAAAAAGGAVRVAPDGSGLPSAAGRLQGAAMQVGRGRVVLIGEAAQFSAQLAGPQQRPMGFNAPGAEQNRTFLLNILRRLRPPPG